MQSLNQSARALCERLGPRADRLGVVCHRVGEATVWDFGVEALGGLEAGLALAEICLAGLATVDLQSVGPPGAEHPGLAVATDHPAAACLGSQYAGWQIAAGKFFAMGSGPMRLLAGKEPMLSNLQLGDTSDAAVGVLEASRLPSEEVCRQLAQDCGIAAGRLTLCEARTGSLAGTLQIVARSVETALHKLQELGFNPLDVRSGRGTAPISPTTADDFQALGWTNDAILYASEVVLWVDSSDQLLADVIEKVPSCASRDYGEPFAEIFRRYDSDFYKIDPLLFSPASITMINVRTGRVHRAGRLAWDIYGAATSGRGYSRQAE